MFLRRRFQAAPSPTPPAAIQDDLMEIDDQLWFIGNEHVPNTFRGQAATRVKAGFLPPFPVEPPQDLPSGSSSPPTIEVYDSYTRPGVGLEDIESLIPEGETGL